VVSRADPPARLAELIGEVIDLLAPPKAKAEPVSLSLDSARAAAQKVWLRLQRRTPRQRRLLLEKVEEYRTLALVERLSAESIMVAAKSPSDALELAELAVTVADHLCPGDEGLQLRAQGYAWFHVCNARRASSNLDGADAAISCATRLWKAGASAGTSGFFNEAVVLALQAKVHQARRRFGPALGCIGEALAVDTGELRGRLLLDKAQILDVLGEPLSSCEALREATTFLDEEQDPRTTLGVQYQLLMNLCVAGRASEAQEGLPRVRALADRLGEDLDRVRVVWLTGIVAAGCDRLEEAEVAFEQARKAFAAFNPPIVFDYALLSLELAIVLLKQGRTAEVRPLAEDLVKLFKSQGVLPEALAAVQLYYEAARREAATLELTQQVLRFLHRAQHDPDLRFKPAEGAEAES
jgi:tetratricopeptide (TPR) repeat protein